MIFLGKNLKYLIQRFATTQTQLALDINERQTTIGNWCNEVSQPAIEKLVIISNFFGVTIDTLVRVDLEKSNLITDEHVKKYKGKSNLKSNPIGNLIGAKYAPYTTNEGMPPVVNETDENMQWLILQTLRGMDGKLDLVRDAVMKEVKKK